MRDVVVVEVHEGAQQLLHDQRGLALGQVLALQDEMEKLSATAVPTSVIVEAPYSSTRKHTSFHSQISCSLMMCGWS